MNAAMVLQPGDAALLPWAFVSSCNPPDREADIEEEQHRHKPDGPDTEHFG